MEKLEIISMKRNMNKYFFRSIIILVIFSFIFCVPKDKSSSVYENNKLQTDKDTIALEQIISVQNDEIKRPPSYRINL